MTESEIAYARWCVQNNLHRFYQWSKWLSKRAEVLALDRYECQRCREVYHRYRKADTVHHVNHLKDRPDLALEIWYKDPATHTKRRNLVSLCSSCHDEEHPARQFEKIDARVRIWKISTDDKKF
jgi:5-methylcytosine-specific restriction protein A